MCIRDSICAVRVADCNGQRAAARLFDEIDGLLDVRVVVAVDDVVDARAGADMAELGLDIDVKPVSYTHLDVYKRQVHEGDHARRDHPHAQGRADRRASPPEMRAFSLVKAQKPW